MNRAVGCSVLQFMAQTDGSNAYGTMHLRPRLPGFSRYREQLSVVERWHWARECIVKARRTEHRSFSWAMLQQRRELREEYIACWRDVIYEDLRLQEAAAAAVAAAEAVAIAKTMKVVGEAQPGKAGVGTGSTPATADKSANSTLARSLATNSVVAELETDLDWDECVFYRRYSRNPWHPLRQQCQRSHFVT